MRAATSAAAYALPNAGCCLTIRFLPRSAIRLEKNLIRYGRLFRHREASTRSAILVNLVPANPYSGRVASRNLPSVEWPVHDGVSPHAACQRKHYGLRLFIDIRLEQQERLHAA